MKLREYQIEDARAMIEEFTASVLRRELPCSHQAIRRDGGGVGAR